MLRLEVPDRKRKRGTQLTLIAGLREPSPKRHCPPERDEPVAVPRKQTGSGFLGLPFDMLLVVIDYLPPIDVARFSMVSTYCHYLSTEPRFLLKVHMAFLRSRWPVPMYWCATGERSLTQNNTKGERICSLC